MWVHETRVEEYLAAGHRLAAAEHPGVGDAGADEPKKTPRKRTAKKG